MYFGLLVAIRLKTSAVIANSWSEIVLHVKKHIGLCRNINVKSTCVVSSLCNDVGVSAYFEQLFRSGGAANILLKIDELGPESSADISIIYERGEYTYFDKDFHAQDHGKWVHHQHTSHSFFINSAVYNLENIIYCMTTTIA